MMKAGLRGLDDDIVLRVEDLVVDFPIGRTGLLVSAVAGISFDIRRGETLGIVGESGCGKTTTGRAVMQLPPPTSGAVWFEGTDLTTLGTKAMREARTKMQMIFQDPISSLNPRRTVRDVVLEPLDIWKRGTRSEREAIVDRTLEEVGIDPERAAESRPHQFSGGQCQRISIARSLVLDPTLIICDEPVSALDVSVQAQVLNLLEDLKERHLLTIAFIAHDLAVVKNISDRVAVMYLGKVCELAPSDTLYTSPAHPYTKVLLESIPVPDPLVAPADVPIVGEPPSPVFPPSGCRFHPRCPSATEICRTTEPVLEPWGPDGAHFVACHHPLTVPAPGPQHPPTTVRMDAGVSDPGGGPQPLGAEEASR